MEHNWVPSRKPGKASQQRRYLRTDRVNSPAPTPAGPGEFKPGGVPFLSQLPKGRDIQTALSRGPSSPFQPRFLRGKQMRGLPLPLPRRPAFSRSRATPRGPSPGSPSSAPLPLPGWPHPAALAQAATWCLSESSLILPSPSSPPLLSLLKPVCSWYRPTMSYSLLPQSHAQAAPR